MAKRLLIVEDNPSLCYLYAQSFKHRNFEVIIAHNGQEALEKFIQFNPTVVLCDIKMPHLSGLDVIEILNSRSILKGKATIIIMSAYDSPDLMERARELGISKDKYLVKSQVSLSDMVHLVSAYC